MTLRETRDKICSKLISFQSELLSKSKTTLTGYIYEHEYDNMTVVWRDETKPEKNGSSKTGYTTASKHLTLISQCDEIKTAFPDNAIDNNIITLRKIGEMILDFAINFEEEHPVSRVIKTTMSWIYTACTNNQEWEESKTVPWEWLYNSIRIIKAWETVVIPPDSSYDTLSSPTPSPSYSQQDIPTAIPAIETSTEDPQVISSADAVSNINKISPCHRFAIQAYREALLANPYLREMTDKDVHSWLLESDLTAEFYIPRNAETYIRYLRKAREALGIQKNKSRYGRESRNIVQINNL